MAIPVEDEVTKAYAEERSRKEILLFPIRIDNTAISTDESWAVKRDPLFPISATAIASSCSFRVT